VYQTKFNGVHHELGTSGFLYRSNKVMYDHATKSCWSTLHGEPIVGPLVGKHPNTTVLSLETGHHRDYGEGVAYRDYFATDKLMFTVPQIDTRLLNKDEVLAFRDEDQQLAIAIKFLATKGIHHDKIGKQNIVVLANSNGASRAYDAGTTTFTSWNRIDQAIERIKN